MTDTTTICSDCGNAIPSSALGGNCPFCLASSLAEELEARTPVAQVVVGPVSYEQIGPYRILDRLGEGGYGIVYRAEQEQPLRRMVAVKIMKGGVVSEQAVARFEAERQALAMMEHPSIAHVYDVGETDEGLPYFVMELIEGSPISSYCDENELGRGERLVLFRQVCEAVGHAHRRGIIHRDLKPSNILVTGEGNEALPKVIDFGIAKATETLLTDRTLVTRDHQLVGTPAYMSPEQAAMTGGDVDTRADIYSLGVVLYEMLTGTTPFRIEELAKLPYDEALRKVRTEDPQRPSSRCRDLAKSGEFAEVRTAEFRFPVSTDLDWIVMKALEKDPERRYETAGAFARDIGRYLGGEAIEARPPTAVYLAAKFIKRHRVPALAVAAVTLAMVVGTIVSITMFFRAEGEAERAEQNEGRAEEQAKRAVESDERGKKLFSRADFTQATPLLDDRRPALAVAHLARALRTNPENRAAATRLLHTLASENWAAPHLFLPLIGGSRVAFAPDGSRILMARHANPAGTHQVDPFLRIRDAQTGASIRKLHLDGDHTDFVISPDGERVAVASALGMVSIWNIETGERLGHFSARGSGAPRQLRFSPDGSLLACTYWGRGLAQIFRSTTGELAAEFDLPGRKYVYGSVDFFADSRKVVFGFENTLCVFDIEGHEEISPPMEHDDTITGVAVLPDGDRVVSWSNDATARVWDAETGELRLTLQHEKGIVAGAVSPEGSRLITGTGAGFGEPGIARLWDVETGARIGEPVVHPGAIMNVLFSPDGTKAASGSRISRLGDGAVQVLDAWTGEPIMAPIFHPRGGRDLAFSANGALLAIGSRHLEIAVWSVRPTVMRPIRLAHPAPVWRAIFDESENQDSVVTLTFGGAARRWNAATGKLISRPEKFGPIAAAAHAAAGDDTLRHGFQFRRWVGSYTHAHPSFDSKFRRIFAPKFSEGVVHVAAASDDGRLLVTGCADGKIRLWSLETGKPLGPPLDHGREAVTALALDGQGSRLASGGRDGVAKLWDLKSGKLLESVEAHGTEVSVIAISPDGGSIATGSVDGTTRLWAPGSVSGLSSLLETTRHYQLPRINHLAFSSNGEVLAVSGQENAAWLWDVRSGRALGPPMRHIDGTTFGLFLLWSPDGRRLVTAGSGDSTARVWDPRTGLMSARPLEQPTAAVSVAMRPDGKALLVGGDHDFQARVWDLASGEPMTPLLKHDQRVYSSAFDATGGRIVTGTLNGSAYLWDVPAPSKPLPDWFLDFAQALAGFRFNDEGVLEQVPGARLTITREEVVRRMTAAEDSVGAWMRWLALDADQRTTSPHSEIRVDQYIDDLVRQGTVATLREALLLRPGDPLIIGKLGYKLVTQTKPSTREIRYGGFLVRRAVELDPDNANLKWIRAWAILQERIRGGGNRKRQKRDDE